MERLGYLGCDVSKGYCDFKLLVEGSNESEVISGLDDNKQGHQELESKIVLYKKKYKLSKIIVGLESTGGYEDNWYVGLRRKSKKLSLEVYRLNPKRTFYEGKIDLKSVIDDGVSAHLIANHLKKNYGQAHLVPKRIAEQSVRSKGIRILNNHINQIVKSNVQVKNSLEKILYKYLPELLSYKNDNWSNWLLNLIIKYPSKRKILNAGIEGLIKIKYITRSKAISIIEAIENSVGCPSASMISSVIKQKAQMIKSNEKVIKDLRNDLYNAIRKTHEEELALLESFKGIGADTAAKILVELPDLENFESAGSLVSFWGLNPILKKSGDGVIKGGISKDGSSAARAELYIAVKNLILHEPYFKALYQKYRSKGKKHYPAVVILMSKLTRIIFGMLKSKKPFDSGVDTYNQNKKPIQSQQKKKQVEKISRNKIMKNHKTTAPISRVERAKRKKIEQLS